MKKFICFFVLVLTGCSTLPDFECPDGTKEFEIDKGQISVQECKKEVSGRMVNHGPRIEWLDQKRVRLKEEYQYGKLNGVREVYFSNGKMEKRADYRRGTRHGHYSQWHENGILQSEGKFQYGKREGVWMWYTSKGRKDSRIIYKQDMMNGSATYWNLGKKTMKVFKMGRCVKNCKRKKSR